MRDLIGYLLKRAVWLVLTLWLVFTFSFILMRSVPGSPFKGERAMPPAIERQLEARYNLDGTMTEQYFQVLSRILLHGDLVWSMKL